MCFGWLCGRVQQGARLAFEQFLPPEHRECLRLPRSTRRTIGHEQNTSRRPDSDPSDRSVAADVLLRQEPDEDEEEDEGDGKEDDDDDDKDEGYSE